MSKKARRRDMRDPRRGQPTWDDRADDFEARPFWMSFKWLALGTLVVAALIAGIWALNVGSSDVQGRGNAVRQKNDATNRIQQQERFEQFKADFDAAPTQIAAAKSAADAATETPDTIDDGLRATDLAGLVQQCIGIAKDYNALGRKYTARDFRDADLPETLDASECQEAAS